MCSLSPMPLLQPTTQTVWMAGISTGFSIVPQGPMKGEDSGAHNPQEALDLRSSAFAMSIAWSE